MLLAHLIGPKIVVGMEILEPVIKGSEMTFCHITKFLFSWHVKLQLYTHVYVHISNLDPSTGSPSSPYYNFMVVMYRVSVFTSQGGLCQSLYHISG